MGLVEIMPRPLACRVRFRFARALWVALAVVWVAACGVPLVVDGEPPEDVDAALLESLREAARLAADQPYQTIRHNPAPESCACPEFEVLVGADWWRVRLEPASAAEDPLPRLRAEATRPAAPGRFWYVIGRLDDDPIIACPNGCYGFELVVTAVTDDPPPPPTPTGADDDGADSP